MQIDSTPLENDVNQIQVNSPPQASSRGRWVLLLLLVFFAVPLLLVVILHRYDWHPQGSSHGELIEPAHKIAMPVGMLSAVGKPLNAAIWRDKWSMVYVVDQCAAVCQQRLQSMRQMHVSFAKDIERVQRILLTSSHDTTLLQQQYPDLLIINQPDSMLPDLMRQFPNVNANQLFLVDPLGNLMMRFPAAVPDSDIRKDISKLLRYSWAG